MANSEGIGLEAWAKNLKPYASVFGKAFSMARIGMSIYGDIQTEKRWADLFRQLEQINQRLITIENKLSVIHSDLVWQGVVAKFGNTPEDIIGWWDTFKTIVSEWTDRKFRKDPDATRRSLAEWSRRVLDNAPTALLRINTIMKGESGANPLMQLAADKLRAGGDVPGKAAMQHSPYYKAVAYFKALLELQGLAIVMLGNAYLFAESERPDSVLFVPRDFLREDDLIRKLTATNRSPLSGHLYNSLSSSSRALIDARLSELNASSTQPAEIRLLEALAADFNALLSDRSLYTPLRFPGVVVAERGRKVINGSIQDAENLKRVNRFLLAFAFPDELAGWPNQTALVDFLKSKTNSEAAVPRLRQQAEISKPFIDSLDKYYQNNKTDGRKRYDYRPWHPTTSIRSGEVLADPDRVITGLVFSSIAPNDFWGCLKIAQAKWSNGRIAGASTRWSFNSSNVERLDISGPFDGRKVEIPGGHVCTGVAFYRKSDAVAIKLRASKLDADGNIDSTTPAVWIEDSNTGAHPPHDYIGIDQEVAEPAPTSVITGVQVGRWDGRACLRVKAGLESDEDPAEMWRKYDVDYLANSTALPIGRLGTGIHPSTGYSGTVYLRAMNGKYVDSSAFALSDNPLPFEWVNQSEGKVVFKVSDTQGARYVTSTGTTFGGRLSSETIPPSECFRWEPQDDGTVALKSSNGKYYKLGADRTFRANSNEVEYMEKLDVIPRAERSVTEGQPKRQSAPGSPGVYSERIYLRAGNGKYVDAAGYALADATNPLTFVWIDKGPGGVVFKVEGAAGRAFYVIASHGVFSGADSDQIPVDNYFTWELVDDGYIALKASNGKYFALDGQKRLVASASTVDPAEKFTIVSKVEAISATG